MNKNTDWKNLLQGSFGYGEPFFASHPYDSQRATEMVYLTKLLKVPLSEIEAETIKYLKTIGCNNEHSHIQAKEVLKFHNSIKLKKKKSKAWLIYWDGDDYDGGKSKGIVTVMDSRLSGDYVNKFLLDTYISTLSLEERIHYSSNKKSFPYPIQHECVEINDAQCERFARCGHNPFLVARVVENLYVSINEHGKEQLHWDKPLLPNLSKFIS